MEPEIWGPPAWKFIHLLTLNYPNKPTFQDKYNYKQFILSLQKVLPCETCSKHFQENIQNSNFEDILKSRESLFEWFVDVHNSVNKQNKKNEWSYDKVYNQLQNKEQNHYFIVSERIQNYLSVIMLMIATILCLFAVKKHLMT